MGTKVEESHHSAGMRHSQGRLPSSASSGLAGLMGMSRPTAQGHVSCGLGNKLGSGTAIFAHFPAPDVHRNRLSMKGTAHWKADWDLEVWKMPLPPLGTNPCYSPCVMQCWWKNTADAGGGTCRLWEQTLNPVPGWLSQARGGSCQGCRQGHRDRHTDRQAGLAPPGMGAAPAGTAPCPTGRALETHRAQGCGDTVGTALVPTLRAGKVKWLWTPKDLYLFRLSFYFDITNHFSLFTNHGCDINTNF